MIFFGERAGRKPWMFVRELRGGEGRGSVGEVNRKKIGGLEPSPRSQLIQSGRVVKIKQGRKGQWGPGGTMFAPRRDSLYVNRHYKLRT